MSWLYHKFSNRFEICFSFIEKRLTTRHLAIVCGVVYIVSLLPLLYIAFFNHPNSDDYWFGITAYKAWVNERSIISVVGAAIEHTRYFYHTWQGTISSIFIMSLPPFIFGTMYYVLATWTALIALSLAVMYLFRILLGKLLFIDKHVYRIVGFITLFIIVHFMESYLRYEAFFWYNSICHYTLALCSGIVYIARSASIFETGIEKSKKKLFLSLTITSLFGFYVGGAGLTIALFTILVSIFILLLATWFRLWRQVICLLIPFMAMMSVFVLSVIAPGNQVRQAEHEALSSYEAIITSFYFVLNGSYISKAMIVFILLSIGFLIPLFIKAARQTPFRFRYPILVAIISLCFFAAMITPPIYAGVSADASRVIATIYIMFILLLMLNIFYLIGWICHNWQHFSIVTTECKRFSRLHIITMFTCIVLTILATGVYLRDEINHFTFSSAMADIYHGNAKTFSEESKAYDKLLLEAAKNVDAIIFPLTISARPQLFSQMAGVGQHDVHKLRYYGILTDVDFSY
ncbi:MAG: hypothetical protein LBC96_05130 [Lachnospiraceae bacterium]|jgi:hypothetical protein|nr:hypothetical protein [Lachnospiraceae bacterium]